MPQGRVELGPNRGRGCQYSAKRLSGITSVPARRASKGTPRVVMTCSQRNRAAAIAARACRDEPIVLAGGQIAVPSVQQACAVTRPRLALGGESQSWRPAANRGATTKRAAGVLTRAEPGVFDQGPRAVEAGRVTGLASMAAAPITESPGMVVTAGQLEFVSTSTMRASTAAKRVWPHAIGQDQRARRVPRRWARPVGSTNATNTASMMARRRREHPSGASRTTAASNRASAATESFGVASAAVEHHREGRTPIGGLERLGRSVENTGQAHSSRSRSWCTHAVASVISRSRRAPSWRSRARSGRHVQGCNS